MGRKNKAEQEAEKVESKYGKNFAGNSGVAERAYKVIIEMIEAMKTNRKAKEAEWLEDLRLWSNYLSDNQMYKGRSNLFIPELHNQVESSVSRFQQGLFPNEDYISCIPLKGADEKDAKNIKDAVFYELDYKNKLPEMMERFQRQKVLYGTAAFKGYFVDEARKVFVKNRKGGTEMRDIPKFRGVKWKVCDTFRVYVYPETVESIEDALLIAEEEFIPKRDLEASGIYENLDNVSEMSQDFLEYGWIDNVRLEVSNLASAAANRPTAVHITECWMDFDIEKGKFEPCVVTIANLNTIIRVQRNPFWHQMPPYLLGHYVKPPSGEFYGRSMAERIRSLQYMMNDLANQTMDSMTYALNPIALIDPGFAGDVNSFKIQPGAKWFASPQGVQFASFPDVSQAGFAGMAQMRGLIQQFSDLSPSVAPQLSGKVRSATQAQAVQSELSQNLRAMIRSDEYNVLGPMCKMTHMLLQQFAKDSYQIVVQGPDKGDWIRKEVRPEDLVGDVHFIWRGSSASQKSAIRSQQLISFFNMAVNMAALMPGEVDLPALYKMVAKDGFDLELDEIFKKDREAKSVDPEVENIALDEAQEVMVNLGDNFEVHMEKHKEGMDSASKYEIKVAYARHMERHQIQKQAKDMLLKQQAQMAAQQQAQAVQQGQEQELHGQMEKPQQARPGNQQQAPQTPAAALQGLRGVEPNH